MLSLLPNKTSSLTAVIFNWCAAAHNLGAGVLQDQAAAEQGRSSYPQSYKQFMAKKGQNAAALCVKLQHAYSKWQADAPLSLMLPIKNDSPIYACLLQPKPYSQRGLLLGQCG